MIEKTKLIINKAAEQVVKQEKSSRIFNDRIEKEINEHQKDMKERRKKFNLLRNK